MILTSEVKDKLENNGSYIGAKLDRCVSGDCYPASILNIGIKGVVRRVSTSFAKPIRQEFDSAMNNLFDDNLTPFAEKIDYIAQRRIAQTEDAAKDIVKQTVDNFSGLKDEIKSNIDDLLSDVDTGYKENLKITFDEINLARAEAILGLRATIGDIDKSLENRITQISITMMDTVKTAKEISERFAPEQFRRKLIEPTLDRIDALESKFFQDVDKLIDKIEAIAVGEIEEFKKELEKFRRLLPNPFDDCRRKLDLQWKSGLDLENIDIYRLKECELLTRIDEKSSINKILDVYGQLQYNAARMNYVARSAPDFKDIFIRDWLKYGQLYRFWKNWL